MHSKMELLKEKIRVSSRGFVPSVHKRLLSSRSLDGGSQPSNLKGVLSHCCKLALFSCVVVFITLQWSTKCIQGNKRTPKGPKVVLFSHFYNEELLLPFWIDHHRHMFDYAMLVNFNSTDRSVDIIRSRAPEGWKVHHWGSNFDLVKFRKDFMANEKMFPDSWKIFLTTTEFLVHDDLSTLLMQESMPSAFRFRSYVMVGDDSKPLVDHVPLLQQRSTYTVAPLTHEVFHLSGDFFNASNGVNYIYSRIMHSFDRMKYTNGLHHGAEFNVDRFSNEGFIVKFAFTPWPETINRKLQISSRIPQEYLKIGMARHHQDNVNVSRMEEQREYLLHYTDDFSKPKTDAAREADHRMFARVFG